MSNKAKVIYLAFTIIVPFIIYCVIYYTPIIRNAPFKASEFVSLEIKWGMGNNLENSYNSATGAYQYLNSKDSLISVNVKLRKDDILYIHGKSNELGFWNMPDVIANYKTDLNTSKVLRYYIKMNYQRKSKSMIYVTDYNEIPKLKDVAEQMQQMVIKVINTAESRYKP